MSTAALFQITTSPYLLRCDSLSTYNNKKSLYIRNIFLVAYFLHVVHCRMHRKTVTPSFGSVSSVRTMSCYATTTRSSFDPLFRSVSHIVSFPPPSVPSAHPSRMQVAIHAVPRRDDFFTRIAQDGSIEKLHIELAKWLAALDALVIRLSAFLIEGNFGRV